jgi:hypothetical protein
MLTGRSGNSFAHPKATGLQRTTKTAIPDVGTPTTPLEKFQLRTHLV